jgi:hypothetical protein
MERERGNRKGENYEGRKKRTRLRESSETNEIGREFSRRRCVALLG